MPAFFAAPLLFVAQAVTTASPPPFQVPPPKPTLAPERYSPLHDKVREQRKDELRRECYSEEAIKLILEGEVARPPRDPELGASDQAIMAEVSAAASTDPVDVERLEAAITKAQEFWLSVSAKAAADNRRRSFDLLRRLPPADRRIFARSFALGSGRLPGHWAPCPDGSMPPLPVAPPPIIVPPAVKK